MRILQISSAKSFGGGERHFVDLCRELVRRGHEVFAALRPTNEWQSRLAFLPPGNFLHTSIRNPFGMFSAKRIAGFAEKKAIDIVHAHIARDYLAAGIACRVAKDVKLVLTRHVGRPMKSYHRFALRNVAAAIAVSADVRVHLAKIFPAEKIRLIPVGVAADERGPIAKQESGAGFRAFHGIPPDVPLVVTLGKLKIVNGQRDLVLAANEIVKLFPACRFVIAGTDDSMDQKFRRELRRLVKVLGLDENVLWLGWLDDTLPLLDAADILVSPSQTGRFGHVILEAMAAGKPVVATETEAARQFLDDADLLAPTRDPVSLAELICGLLDDPVRRREIGDALRSSASANYGVDKMVDATEELYRSLV